MVEISVIIPVYNCEEYLDESVNGILNQTFNDIEVICVDDGSTDNSLEKLKGFAKNDDRVQVYHQENQGGGAARNFALTKAMGKYVYFMDADDISGLTPLEIQDKYALPFTPKYICDVDIDAGTVLRTGEANPLFGYKGGGTQFDLMGQYIGKFSNERLIGGK